MDFVALEGISQSGTGGPAGPRRELGPSILQGVGKRAAKGRTNSTPEKLGRISVQGSNRIRIDGGGSTRYGIPADCPLAGVRISRGRLADGGWLRREGFLWAEDRSTEAIQSQIQPQPESGGVIIYYVSPMRLTRILVTALADTEKTYLAAVENGVLSVSTEIDAAERLSVLQLKVSTIRETSLRSSLSTLSALRDMFNIYRSVAVLRCLNEVRELRAYIEILNETQLREISSRSLSNRTTISLRRRGSGV
ncbi:hypothetical protein C8R45DRAFT_918088 [Mycena sanguinolenta]|nr:hypothetical protein C8R45DRAFT_918088 [Mycena sanguinolenta]